MKSVALFFGSFNPIHIGHLAIANWICEFTEMEEVWFVVSPRNPYKEAIELGDGEDRLEWVRQSVEGYEKFKVCDIEFSMPRPSYTIDTVLKLKEQYPTHQFKIIIGTDNWERFNGWKSYRQLIDEFGLIVYPRKGYEIETDSLPEKVILIDAPEIDVSSTFIRKSIQEGKEMRFFVDKTIYLPIKKKYRIK
ncbi:nicotinate (nicotinamide) nucleotide adenylyltransferase [Porphyromonadaceae bacterium]